jgi:dolichol-phosphate mannosyltransferase
MKAIIILPTFNEAENLPKIIDAILAIQAPKFNLLIVDDDSPDGTGGIADQAAAQHPDRIDVLHRTNRRGLASAYIEGFQIALQNGADFIGQMDSDFSHDPAVLPEMYAALENADIAIGSRYTAGGSVDVEWPIWRKFLSAFGNFYARTILNLPTKDITTGYRLWRRETLAAMPLDEIVSSGYIFLVEMVYVAHKLGYQIAEVPIYFADRKWGESKMNIKIQLEAAVRVWQAKFTHRKLGNNSS